MLCALKVLFTIVSKRNCAMLDDVLRASYLYLPLQLL